MLCKYFCKKPLTALGLVPAQLLRSFEHKARRILLGASAPNIVSAPDPTMRLTGLSGLAAPQSLLPEMGTILARVFSAKTELYSSPNIYQRSRARKVDSKCSLRA
jgi:hypothetical protein